MNLPELLGAGTVLAAGAPKTAEPSVPEDSARQSFMDTMNDTSSDVETTDGNQDQTKPDDKSESNGEAQALSGSDNAKPTTTESPESKSIELFGTVAVKRPGFSAAYAVLEGELPATRALEANLQQSSAKTKSNASGQAETLLPTTSSITANKFKGDNQAELTGEALQKARAAETGTISPSKVDTVSMFQKPLPNTAQPLPIAQAQTEAVGTNAPQTVSNPSAMQVSLKLSDAPATSKVQSVEPKINKQVDIPADADATKSDLKMMDAKLAKEALLDNRQSERRGENASYELKSQERTTVQAQNSSNIATSMPRLGLGQALAGDIAQTATTTQTSLMAAQTENARDISTSRGVTQAAGPSFESLGTARSAASQVAAAIKNQPLMKTIELSLDPPELGRIEIHMEVAEMGLRATLSAERSATGDLIRRQVDLLLQQLDDAGFSDVDLDFRDFSGGKQQEQQSDSQSASGISDSNSDVVGTSPKLNAVRHISISGMDVRL